MESHSGLFSIAAVLRMEMEWKKSSLRGGKKRKVRFPVVSIPYVHHYLRVCPENFLKGGRKPRVSKPGFPCDGINPLKPPSLRLVT